MIASYDTPHHVKFELTNTHQMRMVLYVEDDHGHQDLNNIFELDPDADDFLDLAVSMLEGSFGKIVSIKAPWDANLANCKTDAERIRMVAGSLPKPMYQLYSVSPADIGFMP